jgi:hypothetical protein
MRIIIAVVLLLFCLLSGCATESIQSKDQGKNAGKAEFTKHFEDSLFEIAEKKLFSIEIVTDKKDLKIGKDIVGIIIHDSNDEDVEGAKIQVVLYVPKQGQESTDFFTVTEMGRGLYSVKNIDLQRKGEWELRIKVKKGDSEDNAVFFFTDVK